MGVFDAISSALGIGGSVSSESSKSAQTTTTQKMFDQKAIDKVIYDIMSSDQGLAALAGAENASGGYRSSSKTLLAQDLIAKVAGEVAKITAPEVTNTTGMNRKTGLASKSVICTFLAENGYMGLSLYLRGVYLNSLMSQTTYRGYLLWAEKVVSILPTSPIIRSLFSFLAISRYEYLIDKKFRFWGIASVYVGEPICWLIGSFLEAKDEINGRSIA